MRNVHSETIRKVRRIFAALWCAVLWTVAGCGTESGSYIDASTIGQPLYSETASRAFSYEGPLRNPVVVIHGLLGARLENAATGENVWGDFSLREMRDPARLAALALPLTSGSGAHPPVRATGILNRATVRVLGLEFELNNYETLLKTLTDSGYVSAVPELPGDKHFPTLFEFAYDWRRDISENAAKLDRFLKLRKKQLQSTYQRLYGVRDYPVKFDLVGHSMGGLVARYYAMYGAAALDPDSRKLPKLDWAGAENVSRIVMVGTPNRGYGDTLWELVHGLRLTSGAPLYPPEVIGSFQSYYEMLPVPGDRGVTDENGQEIDVFDPMVWRRFRWGLADPKRSGYGPDSLRYLDGALARARQFRNALEQSGAPPPSGLEFILFAGDGAPTRHVLMVESATGTLRRGAEEPGDGKIPSFSASGDRKNAGEFRWGLDSALPWRAVYWVPGGHMGIMNSAVFTSNLRFVLLELPTEKRR